MRQTLSRRLLLLSPLLVAVFTALALVAEAGTEDGFDPSDLAWVATMVASAATGVAILVRRPGHRVGRALLANGLASGIGSGLFGLVEILARAESDTAAAWVEGLGSGLITVGFLMIPASLLLFPSGELLSRRWRPFKWVIVIDVAVGFLAALINGGFGGDATDSRFNPGPLQESLGGVADALGAAYFVLLLALVLGAVVSVITRFRKSSGDERLQMKWVAAAGTLLGVMVLLTLVVVGGGKATGWVAFALGLGLVSVPVAMAVAILKYRLYGIDLVISRSLTYGGLAVFIGVVYVAIVVGVGELLGSDEGANLGLSMVATAVVAIAFQPARTWVQRWANRTVYGERATPYEVLARFAQRAAGTSDAELMARIPRLIVDGTGADRAALWVRSGDEFLVASAWPEESDVRYLDASDRFIDPDADYSLPVLHDDELLGGFSLVKARGETITPAEEELLTDLAGGLGLALRNARLTAQLRSQVDVLKQSRDRVVSAADEARRLLERDLDSGPQQQLVAVKVKLGPTRKLAQQIGAEKTAQVLEDIDAQLGDAIQAVRDFAGGIYPPLLGAEGLEVALAHQIRKASLPATLRAEQMERYPRDVEAAVYFTVLEALQNAAKYAKASAIVVSLSQLDGVLTVEVQDDGAGFDVGSVRAGAGLNGMADRMDAVGGSWRIESVPGEGTTVSGSVPVTERASV